MKEYNLGFKCVSPMGCCESLASKDEMNYPMLHIEGDESLDLPKTGTATIRFRVVSETEETRGDKEHYRCEIEVISISNAKATGGGDNPKSYTKDSEDALDRLRAEAEAEDEDDKEE
jgi:hypothetical protein